MLVRGEPNDQFGVVACRAGAGLRPGHLGEWLSHLAAQMRSEEYVWNDRAFER
jgi:hypothetical protein